MNIPIPSERNREKDLRKLALAVFKATMRQELTPKHLEGGDLLRLFCDDALGTGQHYPWSTMTDAEVARVSAWSNYLMDLFDEVESYVEGLLTDGPEQNRDSAERSPE